MPTTLDLNNLPIWTKAIFEHPAGGCRIGPYTFMAITIKDKWPHQENVVADLTENSVGSHTYAIVADDEFTDGVVVMIDDHNKLTTVDRLQFSEYYEITVGEVLASAAIDLATGQLS